MSGNECWANNKLLLWWMTNMMTQHALTYTATINICCCAALWNWQWQFSLIFFSDFISHRHNQFQFIHFWCLKMCRPCCSLMFEFSVKCNNLIDWHAKQIVFDTLNTIISSHRISICNAIHCRPPFACSATMCSTHTFEINLASDMHATSEINSLVVVVKWVRINMKSVEMCNAVYLPKKHLSVVPFFYSNGTQFA